MEESHIKALKQYLQDLVIPEDINDDIKKFLNNRAKDFTLVNNVLFQLNQETCRHRKVLNKEEAINAVYVAHQSPYGGHLAYSNTLNKATNLYYWPNMTKDIMTYVKECPRCQRFGPKVLNERLHPIAVKTTPFDQIEIDVNHLPISSDGSRYVIAAICTLTKYVELKPIKYQTTAEIALFIYERIICAHATPSVIITDNGKPMISEMIQHVCRQFSIVHKTGSPYNSQSQGLVERLNRTLNQVLRRREDIEKKDWHAYLPAAQFSYNTLKQAATKQTPFYLLYGYDAKTPFDVVHRLPTSEVGMEELLKQRVNRQINLLSIIRKLSIKRIEISQRQQRDRIDKKLLNRKRELKPRFKLGDLVEVFNSFTHTSWSGKLLDKWTGLFTVIRVLKKGSYMIEARKHNGTVVQKIVHGNRLQKYVIPNVAWHPENMYKKTVIDAEDVQSMSSADLEMPSDQESDYSSASFNFVGAADRRRTQGEALNIETLFEQTLASLDTVDNDDLATLTPYIQGDIAQEVPQENSETESREVTTLSVYAQQAQIQDIMAQYGLEYFPENPIATESLEPQLQQLYKIYRKTYYEQLENKRRIDDLVKQISEMVLSIVHSRNDEPLSQDGMAKYKEKRTYFLKSSFWTQHPIEHVMLKPIKNYVRKNDFYDKQ